MHKNKKVLTCRYAFADILGYQCNKGKNTHKIIPHYDCENCKDYSNKYYMTKEKTMQYKDQNNGNNKNT